MLESIPDASQIFTLTIIAIALGMDALSIGIGLGMKRPSFEKMVLFCILVAFFHIVMPLCGIYIGEYLSVYIKEIASLVGGGMLCFLGGNMVIHSFRNSEEVFVRSGTIMGLTMMSMSVSLDSLSAGLSMGLFSADRLVAVILFGLSGGILTVLGLMIGKSMGSWMGRYGEILGGVILFVLGVTFLWD
ncbi:putative Mn2+ efflux pump MntP [Croceifilum oryzae]|uniref:Putative manganese efflux pump MntP n=1 Tax=Croceifilum oryzae TaxID=1553429 RepID=A0AAJ1TPY1_9BACL|nr:manganese efflux pump [Croceifilum oryzae]MDQ0418381.1 putative Mn2+ efflux pump MntP [Croceifilum oryzae]